MSLLTRSRLRGQLVVDLPDLLDHPVPHRMREIEDFVQRPMQVIGEIRGLLP
jgi:hypothetical protein